jgi:hypothetical protein
MNAVFRRSIQVYQRQSRIGNLKLFPWNDPLSVNHAGAHLANVTQHGFAGIAGFCPGGYRNQIGQGIF